MKLLSSILFFSLFIFGCNDDHKKNTDLNKLNSRIQAMDSQKIVTIDKNERDFAPDFSVSTVTDKTFTLSEHRGKVIAMNFWGVWCAPCLGEIPEFVELQEEYQDELIFVGVTTTKDSLTEVQEVMQKLNVNYPIIRDESIIHELYYPSGWPSTYLINKEGKISHLILGATNKNLLKPIIENLISE